MNTSRPVAANVLDPRIGLATALQSQPGVYALLLGSGVSTGAGILTGWGVVTELVRRAAVAARSTSSGQDLDTEEWWAEHGDGQPLGYSGLLGALASTPAARRSLLAGFFEPTGEDRLDGRKVPGPAHRAIAALVRRGTVRVILTTNFDRLIEQALEAEGILPQVIASPNAIAGMEPLAHARCTVVKLHGDYSSLEQLNTVEELSVYAKTTRGLLHRVLDEYGLLICGWSGDWDSALVDAIERTRSRRYPLFWASYGELGDVAKRLIAQHRAQVIAGAVADQFFPDLVSRLEALDSLADPPLTLSMAVARLKRMLPDDSKYIELRDLFDAQVARVRMLLSNRAHVAPSMEPQAWENAHEEFRRDLDILLHLLAQGVFLDRDRQHTDLWVWVIEQLMRARTFASGAVDGNWDSMQHYPALLALRTVGLAAVAAKHDDVLIRALQEPTWRDRFNNQRLIPAFAALHDYKVLDAHNIETFPVWAGSRPHFPISRWLRRALQSIFLPIVGDEDSYAMLCSRLEYRVALAQAVFDGGSLAYRSAPGEFVGEWQWTEDELAWEADFRQNGDGAAWGWTAGIDGEPDEFSEALTALTTELKRSRRW